MTLPTNLGNPSTSRPPGCRRSRLRRLFDTRPTHRMTGETARRRQSLRAMRLGQGRAFATHTRQTRPLPARLLHPARRTRASSIACVRDRHQTERERGAGGKHSPDLGAFVAERCSREGAVSSQVRMRAQTSGGYRHPRARESLYGEPQDCSNDCAAGHCARLMHRLLPSRFRPLPVERRNGISLVRLEERSPSPPAAPNARLRGSLMVQCRQFTVTHEEV